MTLKLKGGKFYKNKRGRVVRVKEVVDAKQNILYFMDEQGFALDKNGKVCNCPESEYCLVEEVNPDTGKSDPRLSNAVINKRKLDLALLTVLDLSVDEQKLELLINELNKLGFECK